ncbi:MAG: DUF2889 domain-containing protein [Pseudomonadales bacterium]|nr:DUF2889 domain-containing protein [Pseudomonadales bacterium]
MPLPTPAPRRHLHNRSIHCEGYLRDDGMWDIEARIIDTKTFVVNNRWRGALKIGEPIHNMAMRLTVDNKFTVRAIAVTMDDQPHEICSHILENFQRLVGVRIGPGWTKKVKQLLGGIEGCTHLVDLLGPIATVAFQVTSAEAMDMARTEHPALYPAVDPNSTKKPFVLDGCYTWGRSSLAVKEVYPLHYVEAKESN